jgi:hypothetical protein
MRNTAALVRSMLALRGEKRTGVLWVQTGEVRTFVYLKRGVPVFAEEGTHGETLGRLLVRQGVLTQEDYGLIIGKMTDALVLNEQLRFGEVAIELGLLSEPQVRKALGDQVRWKIVRCFQRPDCSWTFEDSESIVEDVGDFPMRIEALFLDAARWLDDEQKGELGLQRIADQRLVLADSAVELGARFDLSTPELALLDLFDGRRTTAQVLASREAAEIDAPAIVVALSVTRVLREAAPAPRAAPASERAVPLARPLTPFEFVPMPPGRAPPPSDGGIAPAPAVSSKPTIKERNAVLLDDGLASPVAPLAPLAPLAPAAAPSSSSMRVATPGAPSSSPIRVATPVAPTPPSSSPHAAPSLERPSTVVPGTVPARPPKSKASLILAAIEHQRVKADPMRAPANEHEAKLLAEQAYQEGLGHARLGRWAAAAPALQRAAQLLPTSEEYKLHAKWAAFRARSSDVPHKADRVDIAKQALTAVKADPNFAFGYYVAGNMAMFDDDVVQAQRFFARAVKLDPDNLDAVRLLRLVERRAKGEGEGGGGGGGILSKKLW